jgi:ABC-type antimicrobial peptide transport system permease subunit
VTLLRGRLYNLADSETTASVAVVNASFVKRFFKDDEDPIGQHFGVEVPENAGRYRIVGVVRDSKFAFSGLAKPPRPMFFASLAQSGSVFPQGIVLVTGTPPGDLEPVVRRTLAEVDPNLTVTSMRTIQEQLDYLLNQERAVASLAELFGIVALMLAAVGVYGVTAYMVAQQTNEIGIRMALGANRAKVIHLVLRRAFQRVAAGLVVGLPLAVGAARFMAAQLYGVLVWDPFALTIAAGSLVACAFLAAIIPAGRAAAISPMSALRTE